MESSMMRSSFLAFAAAAILVGTPALAHPKLLSASPAANSVAVSPVQLKLAFSERLVEKFSGVALLMTEMPGMKMASPMKMAVTTKVETDGKTLSVSLARPLPTGTYRLDWHAVAADTHRVNGSYTFRVK
jgi:methionine-rich copper-binding protein CopC